MSLLSQGWSLLGLSTLAVVKAKSNLVSIFNSLMILLSFRAQGFQNSSLIIEFGLLSLETLSQDGNLLLLILYLTLKFLDRLILMKHLTLKLMNLHTQI